MKNTKTNKPTRTQRACERLDQAVDKLDAALEARTRAATEKDGKVSAKLSTARAENARLRETNKTVSRRLDAAIGRIKAVLES